MQIMRNLFITHYLQKRKKKSEQRHQVLLHRIINHLGTSRCERFQGLQNALREVVIKYFTTDRVSCTRSLSLLNRFRYFLYGFIS